MVYVIVNERAGPLSLNIHKIKISGRVYTAVNTGVQKKLINCIVRGSGLSAY